MPVTAAYSLSKSSIRLPRLSIRNSTSDGDVNDVECGMLISNEEINLFNVRHGFKSGLFIGRTCKIPKQFDVPIDESIRSYTLSWILNHMFSVSNCS